MRNNKFLKRLKNAILGIAFAVFGCSLFAIYFEISPLYEWFEPKIGELLTLCGGSALRESAIHLCEIFEPRNTLLTVPVSVVLMIIGATLIRKSVAP